MGLCGFVFYLLACALAATGQLAVSLQLTNWANQPYDEQQKSYYPQALGALIALSLLMSFLRECTIFNMVIRSNSNLHQAMANTIVRAKIVFFDSNPIGRILTRFSKDMAVLDLIFPTTIVITSYGIFRTVFVSIALCIVNYWLVIPIVFIAIYQMCVAIRA